MSCSDRTRTNLRCTTRTFALHSRRRLRRLWVARLAIALSVTPLITAAGHAAQVEFQQLSLNAAHKEAAGRNRHIMLYFFAPGEPSCARMDAETWSDVTISEWTREKFIALRIDASADAAAAEKFRIESVPTVIFTTPDGRETDRIEGFASAAMFLSTASSVVIGGDALNRIRERADGPEKNDPRVRLLLARTLAQRGRDAEALREYLWCLDQGVTANADFKALRDTVVVSEIARLGARHEPALAALRQRRDVVARVLNSGNVAAMKDAAAEAALLNWELGEPTATLAAYDRLAVMDVDTDEVRAVMFDYVVDPMLEARRYEDILRGGGDIPKRLSNAITTHKRIVRELNLSPEDRDGAELVRSMINEVTQLGGRYYEAMLGGGRAAEADQLAERIVKFDTTGRTFAMLIVHAVRAGDTQRATIWRERGLSKVPPEQRLIIQRAAEFIR